MFLSASNTVFFNCFVCWGVDITRTGERCSFCLPQVSVCKEHLKGNHSVLGWKQFSLGTKWIWCLRFRALRHDSALSIKISTVKVSVQGTHLKITSGKVCELHRWVSDRHFVVPVTETKDYTFILVRWLEHEHAEQEKEVGRGQRNGTATNAGREIQLLIAVSHTAVSFYVGAFVVPWALKKILEHINHSKTNKYKRHHY